MPGSIGPSKNWIKGATDRMEEKGTIGAFGKTTPGKVSRGKRAGGIMKKRAVFAENMKNIASKRFGK